MPSSALMMLGAVLLGNTITRFSERDVREVVYGHIVSLATSLTTRFTHEFHQLADARIHFDELIIVKPGGLRDQRGASLNSWSTRPCDTSLAPTAKAQCKIA